MNSMDNNSQRFTSYRAVIPFYILYDLDLNANHFRLYGQIEQMESNPNPAVHPTFSIKWLSEQLGINERNTRKVAAVLVKKNYIAHTEISPGKWVWSTVKKPVIQHEGGVAQRQGGDVTERQGGDVAQRHPKIPKDNFLKDNNKTPISPCKKNDNSLAFETIKQDNPHNIPEEMIAEWKEIRKKPLTQRVWNKTNNVMTVLAQFGITAKEAFEHMLEKQWQGMELRYFQDEVAHRKGIGSKKPKGNGNDALSRVINKHLSKKGATYDHVTGNTIDSMR